MLGNIRSILIFLLKFSLPASKKVSKHGLSFLAPPWRWKGKRTIQIFLFRLPPVRLSTIIDYPSSIILSQLSDTSAYYLVKRFKQTSERAVDNNKHLIFVIIWTHTFLKSYSPQNIHREIRTLHWTFERLDEILLEDLIAVIISTQNSYFHATWNDCRMYAVLTLKSCDETKRRSL